MSVVSPALHALAALLLCVGSALAAEPTGLRALAREAPRVVTGRVASSTELAEGRFRLYTVSVSRTLAGEPAEQVTVLEERKSSIALLVRGQSYLLFLTPAPRHSLIRQYVPNGADAAPLRGSAGVVSLPHDGDAPIAELIGILQQEAVTPALQRRALRIELESGADRLVADATRTLATDADLGAALEGSDIRAIDAALRDERTTSETKAALIRVLAQGDVKGARSLLSGLRPTAGPVIEARAEALRQLGQDVAWSELAEYVDHPDPQVRKFGVRALAGSQQSEARDRLAEVALEAGPTEVRVAAVEALGKVGDRGAIEVLARTFEDSDPDVQIASGRALFELGTEDAHASLESLVLSGRGYEVQSQALILLVLSGYPTDAPRIQRIRETHPDPRIRKIIDKGLEIAPPGHAH